MEPTPLQSKYPNVAAALVRMKSTEDVPQDRPGQEAVARELAAILETGEALGGFLPGLFDLPIKLDAEFVRFSLGAYRHLGVSDNVRLFMGRLWVECLTVAEPPIRIQFLGLLVQEKQGIFEALDFAVELFRRIDFSATDVLPWIAAVRRLVGNDHYQRGMWGCLEAICNRNPAEAVKLADRWLGQAPDSTDLDAIGKIVGWLRIIILSEHRAAPAFAALEARLREASQPAWRALYIESWARAAALPILTEARALVLRDGLVVPGGAEEASWCFLLSMVTQQNPAATWAFQEMEQVARPELADVAKYWILAATLHGLDHAPDSAAWDRWRDLLAKVLPLPEVHKGMWEAVQSFLVTLTEKTSPGLCEIVLLLAEKSGRSWLKALDKREFAWLFNTLRQHSLHGTVSTALCLHPGAKSRKLGLRFFSACSVEQLDSTAVTAATAAQVELLLLEAQRQLIEFKPLAHLHASLALRVDELGDGLPEVFYEEVATQCLNTHGYRAALTAAAGQHEYLQAILKDADDRLTAIHQAAGSPALKMEVPGCARAERLAARRFGKAVTKGMEEFSIFTQLVTNVTLLYGGHQWRFVQPDGRLSTPSTMQKSSASVELPRLDMMDPEGMHMRRVHASQRIATLEQKEEA